MMTNQLVRCKCGHPLLLHTDSGCKGKHSTAHSTVTCKCAVFVQEGTTATIGEALKPASMDALMAISKRLRVRQPIINIYGDFRSKVLCH